MTLHNPPGFPPVPMPDESGVSCRARSAGVEQIINLVMAQMLANSDLVSLAAGFVDQETLPVEPTRKAMERLARSGLRRSRGPNSVRRDFVGRTLEVTINPQ